jgi:hypothetical protein
VGFAVDKVALRQVFSEYFGFPCRSFHQLLSIIIITQGWHNRPINGRSAEWTQLDSTPPPHHTNLNLILISVRQVFNFFFWQQLLLSKPKDNLPEDGWFLGRELKPGPLKHEAAHYPLTIYTHNILRKQPQLY